MSENVGKRAVLKEYFRFQQKWGVRFDDVSEPPGLIHKHNLKRLTRLETSRIPLSNLAITVQYCR